MTIALEVYPHNSLEPWLAAFASELGKHGRVNRDTLLPYLAVINTIMQYDWEIILISDPYHTETFVQLYYKPVRAAISNSLRGRSDDLVPRENKHYQIPQGVSAAAKLLVEKVPIYNQSRRGAMLSALTNRAKNGTYPTVEKFMVIAGHTLGHALAVVSVASDLKTKIRDLVNGD
jgi:hypothetical protein